jgi:hypothetical protein
MGDNIDLDDKVIPMERKKFSIKDMLAQAGDVASVLGVQPPVSATAEEVAEVLPPLDDLSRLPRPGDPYKAYARPANQMLPTLYLLLANATIEGFPYANYNRITLLPSSDSGKEPVLVIKFGDTEVRLCGRNLDDLVSDVGFHRVAWIRERPPSRDFIPPTEKVITGITITEVEN